MDITKKEALAKLETSEILTRKPVGIKFLFTKEEYEGCPVEEARAKMAYCVMVKTASLGGKQLNLLQASYSWTFDTAFGGL